MRSLRTHLPLLLITLVVLLYGVIYPNLSLLLQSLQINGQWSLANYSQVLSQRIVIEAVITSVAISTMTVMLCAPHSTARHLVK